MNERNHAVVIQSQSVRLKADLLRWVQVGQGERFESDELPGNPSMTLLLNLISDGFSAADWTDPKDILICELMGTWKWQS